MNRSIQLASRLIAGIFLLVLGSQLRGQTVTKTYTASSSVSVDGCGTYCNSLPGVSFSTTDFSAGCEVTDINVSITWAKTAGTCSAPTGGSSRHIQTSFRIDGPGGNAVLIQPGAYTGNATTGAVTTVFDQGAASFASGTPTTGTWKPNGGDLSTLNGDPAIGTWTLRAGDNLTGAPLCIDAYSVTITAGDLVNPAINCPSSVNALAAPGQCDAVVTYTTPVGTDNCSGPVTTRTAGLGSGSAFPVGNTTETYTVTDIAGRTASCSFTVNVVDLENPVITCPSNISVNNDVGTCGAVITFSTPVGTDNCPGVATSRTTGLPSGVTFPIGTTTQTYVATDPSGNTQSCTFDITVIDNEFPTISCPSNVTRILSGTNCTIQEFYAAPSGTDNCPSPTTVLITGIGSGGTFPIGVNTETYQVTDASGNQSTCSFTITVQDTIAPVISCPPVISAVADSGGCSTVISYTTPAGTDNCSTPPTLQTSGLATGSAFPVGTTTNTFSITDSSGNTSACSFDIVVSDNELPVIGCPADTVLTNDAGACSATYLYPVPTGTDNCGSPIVALANGQGSGGSFPFGVNTEVYTATDSSGNVDSCSFTVTVNNTLTAQAVVDQDASCDPVADGQATLNYSGGCPGYSFIWSNGATTQTATALAAGTYSVTVTDGSGESRVDSVTIVNTNSVTATIIPSTNMDTLCASPAGANFQWFMNGAAISGANSQCYVPTMNGQFTVQVTDVNGCVGVSAPFDFLVGNELPAPGPQVQLYPNPTTGLLNLVWEGGATEVDYEIFDLEGRVLAQGRLGQGAPKATLSLQGHAAGMYFLRVSGNEQQIVKKIILK